MPEEGQILRFSALDREEHIEQLKSQTFDLLVVGGGVTGCGIALDAASRGLKVALVEKDDFASGTSSKSTKLIHGGLRYLKQLDFGLVRKTGRERAIVHGLAPHLVLPEKMLLPITSKGTYSKIAASLGVLVYDLMAGVKREDRRVMLSRQETILKEPLLKRSDLKGSCLYAEYRTDDARLTIELIKKAYSFGAVAMNKCKAIKFIHTNNTNKLQCQDIIKDSTFEISAKKIVLAAGPWHDELSSLNESARTKQLHLTKGVHIVFPFEKLPIKQAIYFDVEDGRMVFAIPRGRSTYVGTTDTTYTKSKDRVLISKHDVQYLLKAISRTFLDVNLSQKDIISSWAGLRPLIQEEGKSPSELSRKDEIFVSESGLISITGGKLTGYRRMAKRVVDQVIKKIDRNFDSCITSVLPLTSCPLKNSTEVKKYQSSLEERMEILGMNKYWAWYLCSTYGRQADIILEKLKSYGKPSELSLLRSEFWFATQYEMSTDLRDFFIRRTGRLFFKPESIRNSKEQIGKDAQNYFHWTNEKLLIEQQKLDEAIFDSLNFQ